MRKCYGAACHGEAGYEAHGGHSEECPYYTPQQPV